MNSHCEQLQGQIEYRNTNLAFFSCRQLTRSLAVFLTLLLVCLPVMGKHKRDRVKPQVLDFNITPIIEVGSAPEALAIADFDGDQQLDLIVANARQQELEFFHGDRRGRQIRVTNLPEHFGSLLTGDLNRDQRPDLILIDDNRHIIQPLLNNGNFHWQQPTPLSYTGALASTITRTSSLADLTGDGLLDVALQVISPAGNWQLVIAAGDSNGNFQTYATVELNSAPLAQTALDANNDGISDIAIVDINGVSLLLGARDAANLQLQRIETSARGRFIVSADFNHDQLADLALVEDRGRLTLFNNIGNGFAESQSLTLRGGFTAVVAADFDGDNNSDLALVRGLGDVAWLRGSDRGLLSLEGYFTLSGTNVLVATSADLNQDNRADLITANIDTDTVSILFGRVGGFQAARHYLSDNVIAQAIASDLNSDRSLDLIMTAQSEQGSWSMFSGNGRGDFNLLPGTNALPFPGGLASADLDSDGRADLICASSSTDQIAVILSTENLTQSQPLTFATGNQRGGPGDIVVGDIDGDGRTDVAVANSNALGGSRNITLFLGWHNNRFQQTINVSLNAVPRNLVAGDFNNDGLTDLATITALPEQVLVIYGNNNGDFHTRELIETGDRYYAGIVAGDFNQDRITDLAVTDVTHQEVLIIRLNADNRSVAVDQIQLALPYALQTGDIDQDGDLDLVVLANQSAVILLGDNQGRFKVGPAIHISAAINLIIADFNQDSKNDLIIVGKDYIEPILSKK